MLSIRHLAYGVAIALAAVVSINQVKADDAAWPPKQIKVVIPHGSGGAVDRAARTFGQIWQEYLGTAFIYENKGGASTRIGHDYFSAQPKDGSVFLATNLSTAAIMYAQTKPKWNWDDLAVPVGMYSIDPGVMFVSADSPFKTLEEVIAAAKKQPMTLGLPSWQSEDNLLMHQIMEVTGAQFEIIPHEVSTQALSQVMGGNIQVGSAKIGTVLRGGEKIRLLALEQPTNVIPKLVGNIPTVSEVLGQKMMSVASYRAYQVPAAFAKANPKHMDFLRETFVKTLNDPRFVEAAKKIGDAVELLSGRTPEEIRAEVVEPTWENYEKFGHIFNAKR
jgi:tripartite-type tricarboxylate transporter receptor subunit TctC